ncbi:Hpt domain-containing protein [uncultured Dysosmobacter sp.]|uniref:Hpt domain-containing protein n=1 Tax=uncultured Dysosmobacter sp. TaxID=2591384 RepID=UPI0026045C1F|nr:Hpt domain-containing protein [uncultured Dysosmobacter sp.]
MLKFLEDKSCGLLRTSMAEKNYEEAFRAAHTIKGVCQNLRFTRLGKSSSRLSDALHHGWTPEADTLLEQVRADHLAVTAAIRTFQEECEGE